MMDKKLINATEQGNSGQERKTRPECPATGEKQEGNIT
jgi:hypothetical protein